MPERYVDYAWDDQSYKQRIQLKVSIEIEVIQYMKHKNQKLSNYCNIITFLSYVL